MYVFIAFFPCWNKKLDCRQMKAEVEQTYFNNILIKSKLLIWSPIPCRVTILFWIAFTLPMFEFLNLRNIVFRQYEKINK